MTIVLIGAVLVLIYLCHFNLRIIQDLEDKLRKGANGQWDYSKSTPHW